MITNLGRDPANQGSLAGTFRDIYRKLLQNTDDCLPAKIISYDRDNNTAQVQPLIAVVATDQTLISRPQVAEVPVIAIGGGGFCLNFPLNPGDLGWIKANDRDISNYIRTQQEARPQTKRYHKFADGLFFPDVLNNYTIAAEDANAVVLQSLDSLTKLSLNNDGRVILQSPGGRIELSADGKYNFNGIGGEELMAILSDFATVMDNAQINHDGNRPFTPATKAAIQAIKARIDIMTI